jgi:hypothetical protein
MSITWLLIVLLVVGVAINLVDIDPTIKRVIIAVIVLGVVIALLGMFGVIGTGGVLRFH